MSHFKYRPYKEETVSFHASELVQYALLDVDVHVNEFLPVLRTLIERNVFGGYYTQIRMLVQSNDVQIWKELLTTLHDSTLHRGFSSYRYAAFSIV